MMIIPIETEKIQSNNFKYMSLLNVFYRQALIVVFLLVVLQMTESQPTIQDFTWGRGESCLAQDKDLRTTLELILLEIQRQGHENKALRTEVLELKSRSTQHWNLLLKLKDSMDLLIGKLIKPRGCNCSCECTGDKKQNDATSAFNQDTATETMTRMVTSPITVTTTTAPTPTTSDLRVYPKDCHGVLLQGELENGTYLIKPNGSSNSFSVFCEIHNNEAWTVFQRRLDGTVNFYRTWNEYRNGFGDVSSEFWLGNDNLFFLTNQATYKLKIDMWDWGSSEGQHFSSESIYFFIDNETMFYRLHVPDDYYAYSGFGGSGLRVHAGPFMTFDRHIPNMRENCAEKFHCGWWFKTCVKNANFNGRYYQGGYADIINKTRAYDDIYWPNIGHSLKRVVLKLKRMSDDPIG